ncbi:MAG: 16S rRNA (cytidine(1402)-2'-O)-methyltransferase [Deltaproteobacteria bacterium]|nr:MAG: 16S rRNA (cytidine(1402)-2'-O)-methyltransferase [Deltaproteobacteria bacterium]
MDKPAVPVPSPGTLYVVATPIGHLEDMTLRALRILKAVPLIAAEDTRHSRRLLDHFEIRTRLVSCHEHNEKSQIPMLMGHLSSGKDLALISDAGTPAISDPGFPLVQAAADAGIPVIPIPGASAAIAAISVSGLPTDRFSFIGFAAKKAGKRADLLRRLSVETGTLIFYESPHRIVDFIRELIGHFGNRRCMVAREMTKTYETYIRGTLSHAADVLSERPSVKGECTLIVAGASTNETPAATQVDIDEAIRRLMATGNHSPAQVAKKISRDCGISRKTAYARAIHLKQPPPEKT